MVQFVQHLAHPPVVFITRNIQERQVRDLFKAIAETWPDQNRHSRVCFGLVILRCERASLEG
jgi:hypothetical protein